MSTLSATEAIRQLAADLLARDEAALVVGYARHNSLPLSVPFFAQKPDDAQKLVFDQRCLPNLAVYLTRSEVRGLGKTAVVVKGCDLRAVNVLLRENVVKRGDVFLIGVRCSGVGEPQLAKCGACDAHEPEGCDALVGEPVEASELASRYAAAEEIEAMSLEERWEFWRGHLSRCIRCYACRQACPLCYCKRCIVEKSTPQWVETSAHLRGAIAWNAARAFHLTGRCVGCGECERVCPMDIPLSAINQEMAKLVEEWFSFRSGLTADQAAPFTCFSAEDPEEEIL